MTLTSLGLPALRVRRDVASAEMPRTGPLVDTFGRVATDLRVSLTDRCNLRCTYCMPAEGLAWLPAEDLLTFDELTRLLRLAVTRLGITNIRFTGGEPLLYRRLEEVVAATAQLDPRPEIALTTNGVGLAGRAQALADAGLNRVNVSLDTVDPAQFAVITRRDRLGHHSAIVFAVDQQQSWLARQQLHEFGCVRTFVDPPAIKSVAVAADQHLRFQLAQPCCRALRCVILTAPRPHRAERRRSQEGHHGVSHIRQIGAHAVARANPESPQLRGHRADTSRQLRPLDPGSGAVLVDADDGGSGTPVP